MLKLQDGAIGYRARELLSKAELSLEPGSIKGLIAPNGFGKSSLMRVLSGDLAQLRRGSVELDGHEYFDSFANRDVLYVPGDASNLYGHLSLDRHLKIAAKLWRPQVGVDEVIRVWGVAGFIKKPIWSLSSGMKQQASLAIAALCGPKYLLLDEPTNALDPINAARAIRIFEQMVKNGTSILVSSHLLGTIDSLCDSVIFFSGGGLVEVDSGGDASSVFEKCYGPLSGTIS